MPSRLCAIVLMLCAAALSGCGGGGGGQSAASSPPAPTLGDFEARFTVASVDATGVVGTPPSVPLTATVTYTGTTEVTLAVEADPAIALDVTGNVVDNTLSLTLSLRGDLAPGTYTTELLLHACSDDACTKEPSGSPVHLPIRYVVKPNLDVQAQVVLARTGADAAPALTVPVTVPAEAGTVLLQGADNLPTAFTAQFDGAQLRLQTTQVPAGTYTGAVTLQSATDSRYSRTVQITYTVSAPAGGEHGLSIDPNAPYVDMPQGSRAVQRLVVTRPTWTDALDPPTVVTDAGGPAVGLSDLGGGVYEVAIDATNTAIGAYESVITFSAGPTGGIAQVRLTARVGTSFYLDGDLVHVLNSSSTAADLTFSHPVRTIDGAAAHWTATTSSALIHLLRAGGVTGTDALQVAVDPAVFAQPDAPQAAFVEVAIDRPGTSPVAFQLSIINAIPKLTAIAPSVFVGNSGRAYLGGSLPTPDTNVVATERFGVQGASLQRAQILADQRYIGNVPVLAVDITGAVPGTPVTFRLDNALLPSQQTMQVVPPLRAAASFQALPFGSYRPAQFSAGSSAVYFAKNGAAYRWAFDGTSWSLASAQIPGLIDLAPSPDGAELLATDATHVMALDPTTLVQQTVGTFNLFPQAPADSPDPLAMAFSQALVFSADGRVFASLTSAHAPDTHGVGWVCSQPTDFGALPVLVSPSACDSAGQFNPTPAATGFGLVRSANGHIVVGVGPTGIRQVYSAASRSWSGAAPLPAGAGLAAVSDAGTRSVRLDGMVFDADGTQYGSLSAVLPLTHEAGGYGLSSDGRYGLVYGYRLTGTGAAQRAVDAAVRVVDLSNVTAANIGAAPVVATVAMPQAVGCNAAPVDGETCRHAASLSVAPGDGTAFVLGPRGIAALPLPTVVGTTRQVLADRPRIAPVPVPAKPTGRMLRRPVGRAVGAGPSH